MRAEPVDERALVRAFLERREEAVFRELYRLHAEALFRTVLRLSAGREAEAEDVVQETWVRAVRGLREFRWQSSLRTWLTGIAVRCAREERRRTLREVEGRREVVERAEPAEQVDRESGDEPFDGASRAELLAAIERLPAGFREVLILHDVEGHTHEEIAALLGIAAGTSKSQLSRARRSLRSLLARNVGEEPR